MLQTFGRVLLFSSFLCLGVSVSQAKDNGKKGEAKETKVETKAEKKAAKKTEQKGSQMVELNTSMGKIVIKLNEEKAPISVKNFLEYVDKKHYDGTIFHRVIDGFMIQGGGMTKDMKEKAAGKPIKNEADNGLQNKKGTLAMARTNVVDSATSQFFINVNDNDFLNHRSKNPMEYGYAVFAEVVEGMDVVEKIKNVKTGTSGHHENVPTTPVVIESVKRK